MSRSRKLGIWLSAIALGTASACGDSGGPAPSGPLMRAEAAADRAENRPPVIASVVLEPEAPVAGGRVRARVQARDPDGDVVQLEYAWMIDGRPLADGGDAIELGDVGRGVPVEVRVTAGDGRSEVDAVASVRVGNRRPRLEAVALSPLAGVSPGETVRAVAEATDPDGDPTAFEYAWFVDGQPVGESGRELPTSDLRPGTEIRVRVVAKDASSRSDPMESGVLRLAEPNRPPEIRSSPSGVGPGGDFRYQVAAVDPEGRRGLRFRLASAPPGMTIDPVVGLVTWPAAGRRPGTYPVEIVVEDPDGAAMAQSFEITVSATETAEPGAPAAIP